MERRRILVDGYYYLFLPNHPYATKRGYYLESRKVVEDNIGRVLKPSEKVHHKDKNPKNNDISNLIIYSSHGEHMRIEHKPKLDMSDRICKLCESKTTSLDKKGGSGDKRYPKWLKYEDGFICKKCYDKNKKKKVL